MTFLITITALLWLGSLVACVAACFMKRLPLSIILSVVALGIGYIGITHFHISASKTVNGHVQWSFNSNWFFIVTFVLAALTLAYSIWKHRKGNHGTTGASS